MRVLSAGGVGEFRRRREPRRGAPRNLRLPCGPVIRRPELAFASPRKLPKPQTLKGRVVVLDVAFASEASGSGFDKITKPFIDGLGPRLAAWGDHHDHVLHDEYRKDPRFVLATKAEHGACPEMVTPELVSRTGAVDTIVCHTDFDGLCSAAKWMRNGIEPYVGADADARAIDTRIGQPGPMAVRIDAAIRARSRDPALFGIIVRHLAEGLLDTSLWPIIDEAAAEGLASQEEARRLAQGYVLVEVDAKAAVPPLPSSLHRLAFLDLTGKEVSGKKGRYDKTTLLLLGQERAGIAAVVDQDTLTFAAAFDSGVNFLTALGLSGGMPTLVSVNRSRLREALRTLGVSPADVERLA